jgi:hypothetical protein
VKKRDPKLTREQAAAIVDAWTRTGFLEGDDEIGGFLLLLRTLAYETDATQRENVLIAVEEKLLPMSLAVGRAIDGVVARRAEEIAKGEAVH